MMTNRKLKGLGYIDLLQLHEECNSIGTHCREERKELLSIYAQNQPITPVQLQSQLQQLRYDLGHPSTH